MIRRDDIVAFCKICACGQKVVFERILSFPNNCPACGRRLVDFQTYDENDPRVEMLLQETTEQHRADESREIVQKEKETSGHSYALRLCNGAIIKIPDEGCIVGRTETGSEALSGFPSVSRQHLRVTPRKNIGVIIEDMSSYGTLVDGQRIAKNSPVRIAEGTKIMLCDVEAILVASEVDCNDAN